MLEALIARGAARGYGRSALPLEWKRHGAEWCTPNKQSLFGSFSSEKEQKSLLFLKKKKQKDFYLFAAEAGAMGGGGGLLANARPPACSHSPAKSHIGEPDALKTKSLFASFSSEKEDSFLVFS